MEIHKRIIEIINYIIQLRKNLKVKKKVLKIKLI